MTSAARPVLRVARDNGRELSSVLSKKIIIASVQFSHGPNNRGQHSLTFDWPATDLQALRSKNNHCEALDEFIFCSLICRFN